MEGFDSASDIPASQTDTPEAKLDQQHTTAGDHPEQPKSRTHTEKAYDDNNPLDVLHGALDGQFADPTDIDDIYMQVLDLAANANPATAAEHAEWIVPPETIETRALLLIKTMSKFAILGLTDGDGNIDPARIKKRYIEDVRRLKTAAARAPGADKRWINVLQRREAQTTFYAPLWVPQQDGERLIWLTQFLWMKDHPEFEQVCHEIGENKYVLDLFGGKTKIHIWFNRESLQVLRGLAAIKLEFPGKPINELILMYWNRITHFFKQCETKGQKQFDHILYVNTLGDAVDPLEKKYASLLKPWADKSSDFRSTNTLDKYSVTSYLEHYAYLWWSTLFVMRGHGNIQKSGSTKGQWSMGWTSAIGTVDQERFENIANNPRLNKNLVMDVDSCFSWAKFDGKPNTVPVLSMSSYNDTARYTYDDTIMDAFANKADYDGDGITGYADLRLYTMLNYQDSFMPTKFIDGNGREISIS